MQNALYEDNLVAEKQTRKAKKIFDKIKTKIEENRYLEKRIK